MAGLIVGLLGLGEIGDDVLRTGRNSLHWHKASGDITLVKIDNRSLRTVGRWPWPRTAHAQLIDALTKAGANRIFIDVMFSGATNALDDEALGTSIRRSGRVVLAARGFSDPFVVGKSDEPPLPLFTKQAAALGTIRVQYNYQNAVWQVPYSVESQGISLPSFASMLARRGGSTDSWFRPDYSIAPSSIPAISASSVLAGHFDDRLVRGKDVVVGATTDAIGDT